MRDSPDYDEVEWLYEDFKNNIRAILPKSFREVERGETLKFLGRDTVVMFANDLLMVVADCQGDYWHQGLAVVAREDAPAFAQSMIDRLAEKLWKGLIDSAMASIVGIPLGLAAPSWLLNSGYGQGRNQPNRPEKESIMATQTEIRKQITNKIIEALEQGVMPWRRPWRQSKNTGRPANVVSKRNYSGINPLLLELSGMEKQFHSRFWGTYRQWQSLGCCVQKRPADVEPGHWGTNIVFFRPIEKKTVDAKTGDEKDSKFFVMRTFCVFNADQVEGAERFQVAEEPCGERQPDFEPAEELMRATKADIRHGGDHAFYSVGGDFICLPHKEKFVTPGTYYESAFHEMGHWSEPRLELGPQGERLRDG